MIAKKTMILFRLLLVVAVGVLVLFVLEYGPVVARWLSARPEKNSLGRKKEAPLLALLQRGKSNAGLNPLSQPAPHATASVAATNAGPDSRSQGTMSADWRATFPGAVVLSQKEQASEGGKSSKWVMLVKTDFKYPLLRIEEDAAQPEHSPQVSQAGFVAMVADHIIVKVRPGVDEADIQKVNEKYGGQIRRKMLSPGFYLVEFPSADLDTVPKNVEAYNREVAQVAYAEPDYVVYADTTIPNDPKFDQLWGLHNTGQTNGTPDADIDAPEAWDIHTGSSNMVVGIIDTGVAYEHEDLASSMWQNPGEIAGNGLDDDGNGFTNDVYGWDFCNNDSDPADDNKHGSHVAGTIAGVGNNSVGVVGVNWRAGIIALKFLNAGGSGAISDAVDALNYAIMMRQRGVNIRLTSNSWGGGGYSQAMFDAIEASRNEGMLFIAAAGNNGSDNDASPHYPSSYTNENVIVVAATDHNDALASFSNYGTNSVDLAAPGVNILSSVLTNGYATLSGTSMATPHVAGVAALIWDKDPLASWQRVRAAILAGTDPIPALTGKTVTGGRLNAFEAIQRVGMVVIGSVPAQDEVVFAPPTNILITFSYPYDTNTVQASDFALNGVFADSFTLTDTNQATFHYVATPVTNQGLQTMTIASNSILRASDGEGIRAWTGQFRYDAFALAVTSMIPANGATVTAPFTNVQFSFNEAFDPASIGTNDLEINRGWVVSVAVVDTNIVRFVLDGVGDAEGTLTLTLPAGAVLDTFGNPNATYSGTLYMDVQGTPYAISLTAVQPYGSLIYEKAANGGITFTGDVDTFTFNVDTGQTLSVAASVNSNLQASLELRDSFDALLSSAVASTSGVDVVIQTISINTAGAHTISIAGTNDATGFYTLTILLNAAAELESYDGATNDAKTSAQDLSGSLLSLTGTAARAAVMGTLSATDTNDWYALNISVSNTVSIAVRNLDGSSVKIELYDEGGALMTAGAAGTWDLDEFIDRFTALSNATYYTRVTGTNATLYTLIITRGATFDLNANEYPICPQEISGTSHILGAIRQFTRLFGVEWQSPTPTDILIMDSETGKIFKRFASPPTEDTNPYGMNLASDGRYLWYNAGIQTGDRTVYKLDPYNGAILTSYVASASANLPYGLGCTRDEIFVARDGGIDVYASTNFSFQRTLPAPTYSMVGLAGDDRNSRLYVVSQYDHKIYRLDLTNGNVLGSALTYPSGYEQGLAVIGDEIFVSETTGIGISDINEIAVYDLNTFVLKRRMVLSLDMMIAGLGGDGADHDEDWFTYLVNAGDNLSLQTLTPCGDPEQPDEFHNSLDPVLELYDPNGNLAASDNNSAPDGKNAMLTHNATTSGLYRIRIVGTNATTGEYMLSVGGATGGFPPFEVTGTTPTNGAVLAAVPATLTVRFNANILLTSLQASDLTVDGNPVTNFTIVDGSTVIFNLPALGEGVHTGAIATGAVVNVQGVGLQAYSGQFTLDLTAPRISACSVHENDTAPFGTDTFTVQFSEKIIAENIDRYDLALTGTSAGTIYTDLISYDPTNSVLTLQYPDLRDDQYTLMLFSGDGKFEDLVGNDLDGEPNWPALPTGNGVTGGHFWVHFVMDAATSAWPVAFQQQIPPGSLIYKSEMRGGITSIGDVDMFTLNVDTGQTLAIVVDPNAALQAHVELRDPTNMLLASATGVSTGKDVVIQPVFVTATGNYAIAISGTNSATGYYLTRLFLNCAVEAESADGAGNDTRPQAQNLDDSLLSLAPATQRAAVMGRGTASDTNDWYSFTLAAGTSVSLDVASSNRNAMRFELYDADGQIIAAGSTNVWHVDAYLDRVAILTNATYYARVISDRDSEYALIVGRNAAFDLDENNTSATAQDISGAKAVLGAVMNSLELFAVDWKASSGKDILTLNPGNGTILKRYPVPNTPMAYATGMNLAYDGRFLWFNAGTPSGDRMIYKLDPRTGKVFASFDATECYSLPYGLAYVQGELFVTSVGIEVYSTSNFSHQRSLSFYAAVLTGLAGDDVHNCLYGIGWANHTIYKLDAETGGLLASNVVSSIGEEMGVAVLDDELFVSQTSGWEEDDTNVVAVYDIATFALKRTMPIAVDWMIGGLGGRQHAAG